MDNAPVAARGQEKHLGLPAIDTERPAMAEYHWLSRAQVRVGDFRAIIGGDRAAHGGMSFGP
jgi:hypothetical protein